MVERLEDLNRFDGAVELPFNGPRTPMLLLPETTVKQNLLVNGGMRVNQRRLYDSDLYLPAFYIRNGTRYGLADRWRVDAAHMCEWKVSTEKFDGNNWFTVNKAAYPFATDFITTWNMLTISQWIAKGNCPPPTDNIVFTARFNATAGTYAVELIDHRRESEVSTSMSFVVRENRTPTISIIFPAQERSMLATNPRDRSLSDNDAGMTLRLWADAGSAYLPHLDDGVWHEVVEDLVIGDVPGHHILSTSKNDDIKMFAFTEARLVSGHESSTNDILSRPIEDEVVLCKQYYEGGTVHQELEYEGPNKTIIRVPFDVKKIRVPQRIDASFEIWRTDYPKYTGWTKPYEAFRVERVGIESFDMLLGFSSILKPGNTYRARVKYVADAELFGV